LLISKVTLKYYLLTTPSCQGRSAINSAKQDLSSLGHGAGNCRYAAKHTILIAQEDVSLASFLYREFLTESFGVEVAHDGEAALKLLQSERRFDLLVLDLNLPKLDGISLLQSIRPAKPRMPVLVLTARGTIEDKVLAFQSGTDDFLVKPFSLVELLVRVRALLRRHSGVIPNISTVGDLVLNREERRVERSGRRVELTPREFSILEYMMRNAGRPVSRAALFEQVWNMPHDPATNIVDVYMKYVRDKIDGPGERKLTHTIRGVGYVMSDSYGKANDVPALSARPTDAGGLLTEGSLRAALLPGRAAAAAVCQVEA
jgi:two-component system copper resistance phosphate regulon response regulator CusR